MSYSIANQLLQIIHFNVAGFGLKYIAGFHVSIEADLTDSVQFGLSAGLSDIELIINRETENAKAGFNLVAVFLVYQIDKLAQRAKEEKAMQIVHEIGNNP